MTKFALQTLAYILLVPALVFAQPTANSPDPKTGAELTGTIKEYSPGGNLVLETLAPNEPVQFKLAKNVAYADTDGKPIEAAGLTTNRRVRVQYHKIGGDNVADKISLIEQLTGSVLDRTDCAAMRIRLESTGLDGLSSGAMIDLAELANDRFEVVDTLHRYAFGLDHNDGDSFASALAENCRFDFTSAGKKLGIAFPVLEGRDAILKNVLPLIGPLDTSHTATNVQIEITDDSATLYAYVMSQHFMPRQGSLRGSDFALLMNRYDCELVRHGEKWRFSRITIDNAWAQGDPEILTALAARNVLRSKSRGDAK